MKKAIKTEKIFVYLFVYVIKFVSLLIVYDFSGIETKLKQKWHKRILYN